MVEYNNIIMKKRKILNVRIYQIILTINKKQNVIQSKD